VTPANPRTETGLRTSTLERWRLIDKLLDDALDLPAGARAGLLDRTCSHDPELRENVEQLLRACESSEHFLEQPLAGHVAPSVAVSLAAIDLPAPGARIGAYRIVHETGRGGMGVVYMAERDDGVFQKRVALKLVRRGRGTEDHRARRFQEERQILASLEHPGIARLLDGGSLADGRPYFVMEYVEGTPIDRFCDARGLDVAARLDLFCKVCDAVQHAHEKQVIHRDLKPSNILVTDDAAVKLLDFGIATLLVPDGPDGARKAERLESPTKPAIRVLTPDYASPEQVRGEASSAASDVYSLGIILYELLSGRHPYRRSDRSWYAVERGTVAEPPAPPSDAVFREPDGNGNSREPDAAGIAAARNTTPQQLRRQLTGSLDEVVLTALRLEPDRRYASAGGLAADVRRHLARSPARARPDSWRYRTRTAVQRHTAGAIAVGVGAVLMAIIAVILARAPSPPAVAPSASTIAVFPFTTGVPDTLLQRVGRDLALTLSASLHGVGDLRAVDPQTILAETGGVRPTSATATLARAHGLGAGIVINGSLVRVGPQVRADVILITADGATPVAHVSAAAAPRELGALSDSLTWALLRQLSRIRGTPAFTGAVTTRSLPALRAFLDGEQLVNDYRMRAAAAAFERAIVADSTFWFAYWRHAWARQFYALPVDTAVTLTYLAHRGDFPVADRLLIEARATTGLNDRMARVQSLVTKYADYWPGWFELGELHVRLAPFAGSTFAEAEGPLRRAVSLNRDFVPGWDRLMWVAIARRDTVFSARVLRELKRLRYDSTSVHDDGLDMLLVYRHLDHLARTGGVPDPVLADSLARALGSGFRPSANGLPDRLQSGFARYEFHGARIDLATRELKGGLVRPWFQWQVIAYSWAARGAWDSALVAIDRAATNTLNPVGGLQGYRLAAVGVWLGAVEPTIAAAWRARAVSSFERMRHQDRAELAWVDGLFAASRRDPAALAHAREALRRTGAPEVSLLDSSLAAFAADLAGDRRRARALLVALEHDRYRFATDHPYLTGVNRITASQWLAAAGENAKAARLLTWHEATGDPGPQLIHANALLAPFAYLARARIAEAQGRWHEARELYARFLSNYDAPVSSHRGLVEEARAAIARIATR
jgi:serine/threonine protein kinase/tetratricopeptide (TPR) repeat protein/TolB-like protein